MAINAQILKCEMQSLWSYYHRHTCTMLLACIDILILIVLCTLLPMMILQYNTILPTRLCRHYKHVKWFLTICQERFPNSSFQHQCQCHFHHILSKHQTLQISLKLILFSHLRVIWLLKSVKFYFEPLCTGNMWNFHSIVITWLKMMFCNCRVFPQLFIFTENYNSTSILRMKIRFQPGNQPINYSSQRFNIQFDWTL